MFFRSRYCDCIGVISYLLWDNMYKKMRGNMIRLRSQLICSTESIVSANVKSSEVRLRSLILHHDHWALVTFLSQALKLSNLERKWLWVVWLSVRPSNSCKLSNNNILHRCTITLSLKGLLGREFWNKEFSKSKDKYRFKDSISFQERDLTS